jgi:hypothetical protein
MKLSDVKEKCVFYTKIDLGDGDFVKMRELNIQELAKLNDSEKKAEALTGLFPSCLVDHSFFDDDGNKASSLDVFTELKGSGSLFTEIIAAWLENIPFQQRLRKEQT